MTDGYGNINWWGFSPALDLQEIGLKEMCNKLECATPEEVNILLVGTGDVRHILKTIARRYRHSHKKLRFYVIESMLELYARDMLLMMVALELQTNMGLQDKTELFLEIYGNSLVRQQSNLYVEKMAHELIKMVTDFDYLENKLPLFDLSQLKYKERDFLEGTLKFWRNRGKIPFEISKCWDLRLRQHMGIRYDCRKNVYDWDYNMELIERGASIIYLRQYKEWRDSGVAFQIRDGTYDIPNRTLSSAMVFKLDGERFPRRGYWGDMVVSPFVTFGIETEDKSFYKKQNNMHVKTAEDVSEFNISSLFYEITTNEKYELPKVISCEETKPTAKLEEIKEEDACEDVCEDKKKDELEDKQQVDETVNAAISDVKKEIETKESADSEAENHYEWLCLEDVKVIFLPLACVQELIKKKKYQQLFSIVFFSNSTVHHLKPEVSQLFADRCSLIMETALFMLELKKDNVKEFVKKISDMAAAAGCKPMETPDELQDSYIKFCFER